MPYSVSANAAYNFSQGQIQPAFQDGMARMINVPMAPTQTLAAGTIMGEITATAASDVQTITVNTASPPQHVILTLGNLSPTAWSVVLPQDTTPAGLQTILDSVLGVNYYVVTGTFVAGSGGTFILTAGTTGPNAFRPLPAVTVLGTFSGTNAGTSTATIVHGTTGVGPTGGFKAYASGSSDGSQFPKGILRYPCVVDSAGLVSITSEIPFSVNYAYAPMYRSGAFRIEDLVGLDATALTNMPDSIIVIGSVSQAKGVYEFGSA